MLGRLTGRADWDAIDLGRLKTGTPPRVDRTTVDFSKLEEAPGDDRPRPFSILTDRLEQPQILCQELRDTFRSLR